MNVSNPQHRRRITWSSDISIILGQKCHIYEFFLAADDTVTDTDTDKSILSGVAAVRLQISARPHSFKRALTMQARCELRNREKTEKRQELTLNQ